ncbi:UNVERIFIED_CONTAM: hypothetical protein K2H54_055189 [Gekko kuhli]
MLLQSSRLPLTATLSLWIGGNVLLLPVLLPAKLNSAARYFKLKGKFYILIILGVCSRTAPLVFLVESNPQYSSAGDSLSCCFRAFPGCKDDDASLRAEKKLLATSSFSRVLVPTASSVIRGAGGISRQELKRRQTGESPPPSSVDSTGTGSPGVYLCLFNNF